MDKSSTKKNTGPNRNTISQNDSDLWVHRLGMIPFDAVDNLEWHADQDFY